MLPALLAAFFAAASAAMAALSNARKAALRDTLEGGARAAIERYLVHGSAIESRWLVVRVLGIAISALLFMTWLPDALGSWQPLVAALCAVITYGLPAEVLRVISARTADRSAPRLMQLLRPLELLAAPIAAPMAGVGSLVGRWVAPSAPSATVTESEVENIVSEGELNGSLDRDQSEMIRNVLEFGDLSAGEVMVPRTHVTSIDLQTPIRDVLATISESEHSRYPVYRERIDNVVGILHVKDLMMHVAAGGNLEQVTVEQLMRRPVAFIPETQLASSVLRDMRAGRHHMAIVIDEFGGMSGIVTLEDLVEEIVGDIRDEHDVEEEPPIVDMGEGRVMVDASIAIGDLSRHLGAELPEDGDYNSLGGFVVEKLGRVPKVGARLVAHGFEFTVRDADERHVSKVEIAQAHPATGTVPPGPGSTRSMSAA